MSDASVDPRDGVPVDATTLLARAGSAESRALRRLRAEAADLALGAEVRLLERTRVQVRNLFAAMIAAMTREVADRAVRELSDREIKAAVLAAPDRAAERIGLSSLATDIELVDALLARVRQDTIAAALPQEAGEDVDPRGLLGHGNGAIARLALELLMGESRRRASMSAMSAARTELPAELQVKLAWWAAAAIRTVVAGDKTPMASLDRALGAAVRAMLAEYDEGARLEAVASRLAAMVIASDGEIAPHLLQALAAGRLTLFIALIAKASALDYDAARAIVLEPEGERLWVALRALDLPRDAIARIGYVLAEADSRRDLDQFVDMVDAIVALNSDEAREIVAGWRLDPAYRAALATLAEVEA